MTTTDLDTLEANAIVATIAWERASDARLGAFGIGGESSALDAAYWAAVKAMREAKDAYRAALYR